MFVEEVAVIGAGVMGSALAELMAFNGKRVVLWDLKEDLLQGGLRRIDRILEELFRYHSGRAQEEIEGAQRRLGIELTEEQKEKARENLRPLVTRERIEEIRSLIRTTTRLTDMGGADLVLEAVVESLPVKKSLWSEISSWAKTSALLATNTSTLSITEMASALPSARRRRFLGMHFFNPPHTLPLVEVVGGLETDPAVVEEAVQFLEEIRNHRYPLQPVVVRETPGFVVNRILGRALIEAFLLLEEGVASPRDIDKAMKQGAGWPMGPFELADHVGIDVLYHAERSMREMGAPREQRFPQTLSRLYHSGRWGKKTGRGVYEYDGA